MATDMNVKSRAGFVPTPAEEARALVAGFRRSNPADLAVVKASISNYARAYNLDALAENAGGFPGAGDNRPLVMALHDEAASEQIESPLALA
jgi:hypothetical protein